MPSVRAWRSMLLKLVCTRIPSGTISPSKRQCRWPDTLSPILRFISLSHTDVILDIDLKGWMPKTVYKPSRVTPGYAAEIIRLKHHRTVSPISGGNLWVLVYDELLNLQWIQQPHGTH